MLAIGGFWLSQIQKSNEQRTTTDNQREAALQEYINKMSELLLVSQLRGSAENDEVRKIARARTLTVLHRLDANRKGSLLQFLHESDLTSIIDLSEADLKGANLRTRYLAGASLYAANLEGADLSFAYLGASSNKRKTNLIGANLSKATLYYANLNGANLSEADLSGASLVGAVLDDVNLKNAKVTDELLAKAKSFKGILRNGST